MPLNAFTHFLDEDEEELDEDYVVENSNYSLSKATGLFEQVLDAEPDNEDLNIVVAEILSDPTELAKFDRTLGEHAYEFGSELILRDISSWTFLLMSLSVF